MKEPTFAIITRPATPDLTEIHPRIPVVIPEALRRGWLSERTNRHDAMAMLGSLPYWTFEAYRTTTWVENPLNDGASCLEAYKDLS